MLPSTQEKGLSLVIRAAALYVPGRHTAHVCSHILYRMFNNRKCGSNCILPYNINEHAYTKLMLVVNITVHGDIYRKTLYM